MMMATVTNIDLEFKQVYLDYGAVLQLDQLVIAAGAQASYFGRDEWAQFAIPLKMVEDATHIRRSVLLAFEHADRLDDPKQRRREFTCVVIGDGPTGVEVAGALSELTRRVLAVDFTRVSGGEPRIVLVEGSDRLLNSMSPKD